MKKVLIAAILLISVSCTKQKPVNGTTEKAITTFHIRNYSDLTLNYLDGCEGNIVATGTALPITSGTDTVCIVKIDVNGILSLKTRPGHLANIGGCTSRSITIYQ